MGYIDGMSLYTFVEGDPADLVDPMGTSVDLSVDFSSSGTMPGPMVVGPDTYTCDSPYAPDDPAGQMPGADMPTNRNNVSVGGNPQTTTQPTTMPAAPTVNWGGGPTVAGGAWGMNITVTGLDPTATKSANAVVYMTFTSSFPFASQSTPILDIGGWGLLSTPSTNPPYFRDNNVSVSSAGTANLTLSDSPSSTVGGTYNFTVYVVCNDGGANHGTLYGAYSFSVNAPCGGRAITLVPGGAPVAAPTLPVPLPPPAATQPSGTRPIVIPGPPLAY